jgi:hypothetical protein
MQNVGEKVTKKNLICISAGPVNIPADFLALTFTLVNVFCKCIDGKKLHGWYLSFVCLAKIDHLVN